MNEYIKPPIGVSPHWYIHNKRIVELSKAITRYSDFIEQYVHIKDGRDYYKSIAKWADEIKKLAEIEISLLAADKQEVEE